MILFCPILRPFFAYLGAFFSDLVFLSELEVYFCHNYQLYVDHCLISTTSMFRSINRSKSGSWSSLTNTPVVGFLQILGLTTFYASAFCLFFFSSQGHNGLNRTFLSKKWDSFSRPKMIKTLFNHGQQVVKKRLVTKMGVFCPIFSKECLVNATICFGLRHPCLSRCLHYTVAKRQDRFLMKINDLTRVCCIFLIYFTRGNFFGNLLHPFDLK